MRLYKENIEEIIQNKIIKHYDQILNNSDSVADEQLFTIQFFNTFLEYSSKQVSIIELNYLKQIGF